MTNLGALMRLQDAWAARQPRRATGGRNAIAGFDYQFSVTLNRLVREFISGPNSETTTVLPEALSDIVRQESGIVIVTQVKIRHTSATTKNALDELWEIYKLAQELTPELARFIRFEIQAARSASGDVQGVVRSWTVENGHASSEFAARVDVATIQNPEWDTVALLHSQLSATRPFDSVYRWLGYLVAGARSKDGLGQASERIWNELVGILREKHGRAPVRFHLWKDADVQPKEVAIGKYLTGQQPLVNHLRSGFFAARPIATKYIEAAIMDWVEANDSQAESTYRVPVFWIGGRSGSGKSVQLLQTCAFIHTTGLGRVLWLGNRVTNLPGPRRCFLLSGSVRVC